MSYWTTLAVVAGYGTLFLLSDSQQKRQARELQSSQMASSQSSSSSSSRSSVSSSPHSSDSLVSVSCGIKDLKREGDEELQKEHRRRFSDSRHSLRIKTKKKDLRSVGSACSSTAVSLPPPPPPPPPPLSSSSCSCSSYVIRKDAAVHPSLSSLTGGCRVGSTAEKSQSPPSSSCSRLQASFASVNARILYDDGNDVRGNLDDGNNAENLDDDENYAWNLNDGIDDGNLDDGNDAGNVDDDGSDGCILEESEAHRPVGATRMPSTTAAAAAANDEEEDSKWQNSIQLVDIHATDFISRLQDDDWRHCEGQKVVTSRVSKEEKRFDGQFMRKPHPKRYLQNSTSHKTNLPDNTEPSHKTNLPDNTEPSHKTNLPDKKPRNNTLVRNKAETGDKTNLPNNKKPQNKINLPNSKRPGKTNLRKTAQPSYGTILRNTAEPRNKIKLGKKAESSDKKGATSSANSSANDGISTASFGCSQESGVWQKRDLMDDLAECQSCVESTASSDVSCSLTKTLSSSLLTDQSSVKDADHHRRSTNTGGSKDRFRAYPSNVNCISCSSSQATIAVTSDKGAREDAAGVSDCCGCVSIDDGDATAAEENSSTGFGFESFLSNDQPVGFSQENENADVRETDLLRKERKREELCRSDAIPARAEQSLKKCTDDYSKQRSPGADAVPFAGIDTRPSASSVQSSETKSLVRWSFLEILDWMFVVLLLLLIVLYTLDHLFDLTKSKVHQPTVSTELHSSSDQFTVSCDAKD